MNRLLVVFSLILFSLVGSLIIQVPYVLAYSDNQTSNNSTPQKTINAKITLVNNTNGSQDNQTPSTQANHDSNVQGSSKIPKWIKSTFIAYAQGDISEDELLNAIAYLVQNNIIKIQSVPQPSTAKNTSPNTAANTSNQPIVTNSDFAKINANADNYQDRLGKFSGKITSIDTQKSGTTITIQLEEYSFDKFMVVILKNQDIGQYKKDDCVSVEGSIKGKDRDPNELGALLPYPKLNGQKLTKISCLDALYPTFKTLNLNLSKKAGNVAVTVSKVEFAEQHTRVFVIIQNFNTDREVYFSGQQIIQDHSQYNLTSKAADEKGISFRILPGIIEKGYLFFDPVSQHPFKISLEAREQFLPSKDLNNTYDSFDHKLIFDVPLQ